MALIKCPECGGSVSSNAKQCIHCGCKFTACPECGNVSVGEISVCPVCGYEIKKTASTPQFIKDADTGSEQYKNDILGKWQKSSLADNTILKLLKAVKIASHVLAVILLAVAVVLFMLWKDSSVWERLAGLNKLKTSLNCLIAFSCIFEIFDMVIEYGKNSFIKLRCCSWINSRPNFDAIAYLMEYDTFVGTEQDEDDLGMFIEAAYLSETRKGKGAIYAGLVLRIILAVALWTCVGVCIMQNAAVLIAITGVEGMKFEFQYTALIGAAVSAVLYFCTTLICDSRYNKGYQAWLKRTFPDWFEEQAKLN